MYNLISTLKSYLLFIILTVVSTQTVFGSNGDRSSIDLELLHNDKEEVSRILTKKDKAVFESFGGDTETKKFLDLLNLAVLDVKESKDDDFVCDLGLINSINEMKKRTRLTRSNTMYFKMLRYSNYIDDIFLSLLLELESLNQKLNLGKVPLTKRIEVTLRNKRNFYKNNNISKLYSEFSSWPDENSTCSLGAWYRLSNKVAFKKNKYRKTLMHFLNRKALAEKAISNETYNKLEVLRESNILERNIFLSGYLDKVFWSKNLLKSNSIRNYDIPSTIRSERFAQKTVKTFSKVTYREQLYRKYNNEQIVVLAKILKKASMRMGVDPEFNSSTPFIQQVFSYTDEDGNLVEERDIYVLDNATDQYDYARRRMRMDIYNTNMYKSFSNVKITYEDIIMASLETGYISHEEVQLALEYDDLWNKNESKLMKAVKFTLRIGGSAVFYLPPPYNIIGAVGVALINALFINKPKGEDNDNPASLFN